jgi:HPt (histidine-containing phosphotransfer) domain-containing protein
MAKPTNNEPQPAVTTFADHEVIVPPNKLKKAVVRAKPGPEPEPDPVASAEEALAELSVDFAQWMENECQRLNAARGAVKSSGFSDANRDELFRAAHDIKGEAATFGFPLIEPVAESLCRLIEHSPDPRRIPLQLIDQHVDGIRAIVHKNARGDTERTAVRLASRLRQVTDEFLVHENRHRPGYLEGLVAPPLAPDDSAN